MGKLPNCYASENLYFSEALAENRGIKHKAYR